MLLNTLYVMTPNAYVHLENDTLRIDVEHEKKMQGACTGPSATSCSESNCCDNNPVMKLARAREELIADERWSSCALFLRGRRGQQSEPLTLGSLPQTAIETNEFEGSIARGKAVKCSGQLESVA